MKQIIFVLLIMASPLVLAQPGAGRDQQTSQQAAPIALEGYWISVVTEDWMFRMVTPPKGSYLGVPLNQQGRRVADLWDPEADERLGNACRSYGAPALMRVPGRIQIEWADEETLSIATEAGTQTRTFHFSPPSDGSGSEQSLQGLSKAQWKIAGGQELHGNLKVETEYLAAGYLRKNGVPYSQNAKVIEYYSVYDAPNGDAWMVITTEVDDPQYLSQTFVTSTHFKKLSDRDGLRYWKANECSAQ